MTCRPSRCRTWMVRSTLAAIALAVSVGSVHALDIVLEGVAPDRIERQRANARGDVPLPATPDLTRLRERLTEAGVSLGDDVFIRMFKEESELELWVRKGPQYVLLATYPICFWSGGLGPKMTEGDRQTPEGVYTLSARQLRLVGRWPRSLNLGFPNPYDAALKRTGSYILVHGGCSSVGCYAMTDPVIAEIHTIASSALRKRGGQKRIQVHAFPFRLTDANMARHASSRWVAFWSELKTAYDLFEESRVPPQTGVCNGRYVFARSEADKAGNLAVRTLRPAPTPAALSADEGRDVLACQAEPATAHDAAPSGGPSGAPEREASSRPAPTRSRVLR